MAKCWIIEKGEYSDYQVLGIFSTKENADRICAMLREAKNYGDEPEVVERELDPFVDELNAGYALFCIVFRNNEISLVTVSNMLEPQDYLWANGNGAFYIWAKDRKAALKIVAERHARAVYERDVDGRKDGE